MPYLKTTWFGVFLYDDDIIEKKLFPKDADEIASRMYALQHGEILDEERAFAPYQPVVDDARLKTMGTLGTVKKMHIIPEDFGYGKDLFRDACLKLAQKVIGEEQQDRTKRIAEAVDAFEDLLKVNNILLERLRSWYSYFSPEALESEEHFAERLQTLSIGEGALDVAEHKNLTNLAALLTTLSRAREELESYIHAVVEEMAPNVSAIVGHGIAARLIAQAGSITRLAVLPAGTVQVLGAERALFRHLKDGAPPPKHGILFQHEMVNRAPKNKRGKIARLLATKVAIAAKADAFTKNFIAEELKKEIERRYAEIMA
ncbi:MAG TPA: hypothetical protein ENG06_03600 [Thermoplasmatales archaeon]|nr:hypothetical protein [Thermoplasmatales archaeon]